MALEAVVFPQNPFSYYNDWSYDGLVSFDHDDRDQSLVNSINILENQADDHHDWKASMVPHVEELHFETRNVRGKRRRKRTEKNKEDIHNQRMTHIAVERNRRKQMNHYLSLLRSIMPDSYVQRGDQASIIGGAINFVKELEQKAQVLGVGKLEKIDKADEQAVPFSEFFTFPQCHTAVADVEVMMVECHVSIKIRSKSLPKQLLKLLSGLHAMSLAVLHLNVTTHGHIVLYSLNVKMEEDCTLSSVDEIATGVYQILVRVQQEDLIS